MISELLWWDITFILTLTLNFSNDLVKLEIRLKNQRPVSLKKALTMLLVSSWSVGSLLLYASDIRGHDLSWHISLTHLLSEGYC